MLNITIISLIKNSFYAPLMFSGPSKFTISHTRISNSLGIFLLNPKSFRIENSEFTRFQNTVIRFDSDDSGTCENKSNGISGCNFVNISNQIVKYNGNDNFDIKDVIISNCQYNGSLVQFGGGSLITKQVCVTNCSNGKVFDIFGARNHNEAEFSYVSITLCNSETEPQINKVGPNAVKFKNCNFTKNGYNFTSPIVYLYSESEGDSNVYYSTFFSNYGSSIFEVKLNEAHGNGKFMVVGNSFESNTDSVKRSYCFQFNNSYKGTVQISNSIFKENNFILNNNNQMTINVNNCNFSKSFTDEGITFSSTISGYTGPTLNFSGKGCMYNEPTEEIKTNIPKYSYDQELNSKTKTRNTIIIVVVIVVVVAIILVISITIHVRKVNAQNDKNSDGDDIASHDYKTTTVSTNPLQVFSGDENVNIDFSSDQEIIL